MEDYAILVIIFLMAVCLMILTVIGYWGVFCKAGIAFVLTVMLYHRLSKAFGHGFGYTVGIMFLPFIFVLLLGVGRSRYTRPDKYRDKF